MSEYYKQLTGTPESAAKTTGADRIQADREIWARLTGVEDTVDKLEENPVVPAYPTDNGDYFLRISSGTGGKKTYTWTPVEIPALPSEAGSYTLTVTVDGTDVTYSWSDTSE